eukprot:m.259375 g.259375  ORF g.259375 m.259375 type:complete len:572 (-) comp37947_c0_seq1:62-1777(-)
MSRTSSYMETVPLTTKQLDFLDEESNVDNDIDIEAQDAVTVDHHSHNSGADVGVESNRTVVHNIGIYKGDAGFDTSEYLERRKFFKNRTSFNVNDGGDNNVSDDKLLENRGNTMGDVDDDNHKYRQRRAWYQQNRNLFKIGIPREDPDTSTSPGKAVKSLALLTFCAVFGMCTWFSAGAVLPQLLEIYNVSETAGSLLTLAVNFGFLLGALGSVLFNLADRIPPSRLMAIGSTLAAVFNVGMLIPGCNFGAALFLRILTGAAMALVYPMACKVASSWFVENRGAAVGFAVGAVGLGSASPYLISVIFGAIKWESLLIGCSGLSIMAAVVARLFLREGPHLIKKPSESAHATPSDISGNKVDIRLITHNRAFWLATAGYCGHNWELFALWLWFKPFALEAGIGATLWPSDQDRGAALAAFLVIAASLVGCIGAGMLADKWGRTSICLGALLVSIFSSVSLAWITDAPIMAVIVSVLWGMCAAGESAQYSAMVTEVVDKSVVGNAATMQFGIGFIFTMPGMFIVPSIVKATNDWALAWGTLTPGAVVAVAMMIMMRRNPIAVRVAKERGRPVM